jgi:hypothetical protein
MTRERVLEILRDDVKAARKRFQDTTEYFDEAIHGRQNSISNANRQQRVSLAARSYRLAAHDLTTAVVRLNRFMLDGVVPDVLKPKPPRKAEHTRSISSAKSA